jgi:regulator of RNase E activity RraA
MGLAGVVVDGCIRDVDALMQLQYPVWSTKIAPAHPKKRAAGSVNVPVQCNRRFGHFFRSNDANPGIC